MHQSYTSASSLFIAFVLWVCRISFFDSSMNSILFIDIFMLHSSTILVIQLVLFFQSIRFLLQQHIWNLKFPFKEGVIIWCYFHTAFIVIVSSTIEIDISNERNLCIFNRNHVAHFMHICLHSTRPHLKSYTYDNLSRVWHLII